MPDWADAIAWIERWLGVSAIEVNLAYAGACGTTAMLTAGTVFWRNRSGRGKMRLASVHQVVDVRRVPEGPV
jgi:hypothetical protein